MYKILHVFCKGSLISEGFRLRVYKVSSRRLMGSTDQDLYLAHVIEQPIFQIPNLEYLQRNFCFDFLMILGTYFEASLRFRKN